MSGPLPAAENLSTVRGFGLCHVRCARGLFRDGLDAGLEYFGLGGLSGKFNRRAMDGAPLSCFHCSAVVDGLAEHVEDTAKQLLAARHSKRLYGVSCRVAAGASS